MPSHSLHLVEPCIICRHYKHIALVSPLQQHSIIIICPLERLAPFDWLLGQILIPRKPAIKLHHSLVNRQVLAGCKAGVEVALTQSDERAHLGQLVGPVFNSAVLNFGGKLFVFQGTSCEPVKVLCLLCIRESSTNHSVFLYALSSTISYSLVIAPTSFPEFRSCKL